GDSLGDLRGDARQVRELGCRCGVDVDFLALMVGGRTGLLRVLREGERAGAEVEDDRETECTDSRRLHESSFVKRLCGNEGSGFVLIEFCDQAFSIGTSFRGPGGRRNPCRRAMRRVMRSAGATYAIPGPADVK